MIDEIDQDDVDITIRRGRVFARVRAGPDVSVLVSAPIDARDCVDHALARVADAIYTRVSRPPETASHGAAPVLDRDLRLASRRASARKTDREPERERRREIVSVRQRATERDRARADGGSDR